MICKSDKPYPKIQVERPNKKYAKLLLEDYAGNQSEDTAIHLYLYQSLVSSTEYRELARDLKDIAKVEMHHLFLLGKTIKLLGLEPVFASISDTGLLIPWTSSGVNYATDIQTMLEVDIEREMEAICNYEKHIKLIDDKYVKVLLKRIIEDEKIHISIFHYYYQKIFYER